MGTRTSLSTCIIVLALVRTAAVSVSAYEYAKPPVGDFTEDYLVDFEDLKMLADDWLGDARQP